MKDMTIGQRIQQLRRAAGLSQEQLAEGLQVSRQSVSKWELDDAVPEVAKIIAISDFFGVSIDELLRGRPSGDGERNTALEAVTRLNMAEKRIRTGLRTAIGSTALLILELMLLPVMRMAEFKIYAAFRTNVMDYAREMPMSLVICLTVGMMAAGVLLMMNGRHKIKKEK